MTAKMLGTGTVKLTGGEPFLRRDIAELMKYLSDEGLCIDIESNGTLIDHDMARLIRDCRVRQVSISLDAADPRQHEMLRGTSGVYEKTVAAIKYLCEEQVTTQVIMSLYNENKSEIEPLAARCEEWGIPSLKINPIMPTGRGEGVFKRRENVSVEELIRLDRWIEANLRGKYSTDIYFCMPIGLKSLNNVITMPLYECHVLNILGILSDGTISLCGIGQTETELNMGNITTDDLESIWRDHPLLLALRADTPARLQGICGRCIFKYRCLGSCRACAYAMNGDLKSPFFMCEEAYEKKLFPESRLYN
jgi:SynChlorMet cassette radical SAM/SPASM protein ScmF